MELSPVSHLEKPGHCHWQGAVAAVVSAVSEEFLTSEKHPDLVEVDLAVVAAQTAQVAVVVEVGSWL